LTVPPPPGPMRLALALPLGGEGGGQLGLGAAPQGPADHASPDLPLAEEVAVRAALCPGHVDPSLPSHRGQATNTASRKDDHRSGPCGGPVGVSADAGALSILPSPTPRGARMKASSAGASLVSPRPSA